MRKRDGRPTEELGRLKKELRVYDLLDCLQIPYQQLDHPAAMTMDACAKIETVLGSRICKNLLLCNRQGTSFYLLLLPGDKPFKSKELSGQIGSSRLSFAGGDQMVSLLDISPGSLSVMGLMNDTEQKVQLLVDRDLLSEPRFGCHPCINTSSICFTTEDLIHVLLPALGHSPTFVTLPQTET